MNKVKAIKTLLSASEIYNTTLLNKNIIFVFEKNSNQVDYVETKFSHVNFLHLTGVEPKGCNAHTFFLKCISKKLSQNDFSFKDDGITEIKLSILINVLSGIVGFSKMIGDFSHNRIKLSSDKIVGGVNICIGFVKSGNFYYPNTILKEDIRDITIENYRIIGISTKKFEEKTYTNILYNAKPTKKKSGYLPDEIIEIIRKIKKV
jgi:hypothetical protein